MAPYFAICEDLVLVKRKACGKIGDPESKNMWYWVGIAMIFKYKLGFELFFKTDRKSLIFDIEYK